MGRNKTRDWKQDLCGESKQINGKGWSQHSLKTCVSDTSTRQEEFYAEGT